MCVAHVLRAGVPLPDALAACTAGRIILLAHDDGYWNPSQGLAFSLQAVRALPAPESAARSAFARFWAAFRFAVNAVVHFIIGIQSHDAAPGGLDDRPADDDDEMDDVATKGDQALDPAEQEAIRLETGLPQDCPLSYSMLAVIRSMPPALSKAGLPKVLARRIWTTQLTCAVMDTIDVSWAMDARGYIGMSPVGDPSSPSTLLDRGEAWLAAQELPEALRRTLHAAAARRAADWRKVQDQRVTAMRAAELSTLAHGATVLQRTAGSVVRAVVHTHETVSIFVCPYLDCITRWCVRRPCRAALVRAAPERHPGPPHPCSSARCPQASVLRARVRDPGGPGGEYLARSAQRKRQ
jgi:hypothetical protein